MICTHNNFGTSYISPMAHEMLNDTYKKKDVFSLPKIKRGQSLSRTNYRKSIPFSGKKGQSVKRIRKDGRREGVGSSRKDFMYPYSLFEKIMKIKGQ